MFLKQVIVSWIRYYNTKRIKQKEDDVSIQDRVTSAAQTTGKFTSEQVDKVKDKVKDKVEDNTDKEARVK